MKPKTFDALTKILATSESRRHALQKILGVLGGGSLATLLPGQVFASKGRDNDHYDDRDHHDDRDQHHQTTTTRPPRTTTTRPPKTTTTRPPRTTTTTVRPTTVPPTTVPPTTILPTTVPPTTE